MVFPFLSTTSNNPVLSASPLRGFGQTNFQFHCLLVRSTRRRLAYDPLRALANKRQRVHSRTNSIVTVKNGYRAWLVIRDEPEHVFTIAQSILKLIDAGFIALSHFAAFG